MVKVARSLLSDAHKTKLVVSVNELSIARYAKRIDEISSGYTHLCLSKALKELRLPEKIEKTMIEIMSGKLMTSSNEKGS